MGFEIYFSKVCEILSFSSCIQHFRGDGGPALPKFFVNGKTEKINGKL